MIDIKEDLFDCPLNKINCNIYKNVQKYKNYVQSIEIEPQEYNINYRLTLKIKIDLIKFQKVHKKEKYDNHIKNNNDTVAFILMNSSYASKTESDKTINNCIEIAGYHNYSNIEIYNLSPFRTPDPECLNKKLILKCPAIASKTEKEKNEIQKIINNLDEQNREKLKEVANSNNKTIIIAWGVLKHVKLKENAHDFLRICKDNGKYQDIKCIAMNKDKIMSPRHPCYATKEEKLSKFINFYNNEIKYKYLEDIIQYINNNTNKEK